MASPPALRAVPSWWLSLASRLGRVAILCLIVGNFFLLLAGYRSRSTQLTELDNDLFAAFRPHECVFPTL